MSLTLTQLLLGIASGLAVLILISFLVYRHQLKKVGPNKALIVYGKKGTTVVAGGAHLVNPFTERYQEFSLELMSFEVAPTQELYTAQGIAVTVRAVTQTKVCSDNQASIRIAAEQFLSKSDQERETLIRLVMEGHLRNIIGHLTVEDLVNNADHVAQQMVNSASPVLDKMGLVIVSFTIKDVLDKNDYILSLGRPRIEELLKQTAIYAAHAQRDRQIEQANAARETAIAQAKADQERMKAETDTAAYQAELQRNLSLKQSAYTTEVKQQQAVADKAYDLRAIELQQQLTQEQIRAQDLERQRLLLDVRTQVEAARIQEHVENSVVLPEITTNIQKRDRERESGHREPVLSR